MLQQEDVYRECLSGHKAETWRFGVDRSRDSGLNAYCKDCVKNAARNRRERIKELGEVPKALLPSMERDCICHEGCRLDCSVHHHGGCGYIQELVESENTEAKEEDLFPSRESSFSIFGSYFQRIAKKRGARA